MHAQCCDLSFQKMQQPHLNLFSEIRLNFFSEISVCVCVCVCDGVGTRSVCKCVSDWWSRRMFQVCVCVEHVLVVTVRQR